MTNTATRLVFYALIGFGASRTAFASLPSSPQFAREVRIWNIPAEDAAAAIRDFGLQSGISVFAGFGELQGKRFNAVVGSLSVDAALAQLVAGTGLEYKYNAERRAISFTTIRTQQNQNGPHALHEPLPAPKSRIDSEPVLLEEIVVMAQKRPENLQNVPMSAEVFIAQDLAAHNLNSLTDIATMDATLRAKGTAGRSGSLSIRGIESGSATSLDQSVGMFVDDIYHGRVQTVGTLLPDLDHVEVLKGPQSTFFGNNATAGAYNIVTAQPTDTFEASIRGVYGAYGRYDVEGALNLPLAEALQVRLAVETDGENGWLHNLQDGKDYPRERNVAARVSVRLRLDDDLDATLKLEGGTNHQDGGLILQLVGCPPPPPFTSAGFCKSGVDSGVPQGLGNNFIDQAPGQMVKLSTGEDVFTVHYRKWDHIFTSVSGFYRYRYLADLNATATPINEVDFSTPQHFDQFSQELRVTSPIGQSIEYLAGLYMQGDTLKTDVDQTYFFLTPTILASPSLSSLTGHLPLAQQISYQQQERVYSAFGSATWHLTDNLEVSAGLRDTLVKKDFGWRLFYGTAENSYDSIASLPQSVALLPVRLGLGTPGDLSGYRSDRALMPSGQIQYGRWNWMSYFSYSNGWKAGGFNADENTADISEMSYGPERVNAYEIGLKSEWLQHTILINTAVFRSDYTQLQVSRNLPTASGTFIGVISNAANARSQGVEFEGKWLLSKTWRVAGQVTYLDSRYTSYPNVSPTTLQVLEGVKVADKSGVETDFAPEWSGNVSATYRMYVLGNYGFSAEVISVFSSNFAPLNVLDRLSGEYVRLDGLLTLDSPGERWKLDIIGTNLTNRNILALGGGGPQATSMGTTLLQKQRPRAVAVQIRFKW